MNYTRMLRHLSEKSEQKEIGSLSIIPKNKENGDDYERSLTELLADFEGRLVSMRFVDKFGRTLRSYEGKVQQRSRGYFLHASEGDAYFGPLDKQIACAKEQLVKVSGNWYEYHHVELHLIKVSAAKPRLIRATDERESLELEYATRSADHFR